MRGLSHGWPSQPPIQLALHVENEPGIHLVGQGCPSPACKLYPLPAFAMWTAFPSSDYYAGSAPAARGRRSLRPSVPRRGAVTRAGYLGDLDRHMSELPKDAEYRSPVYATFRAALLQAEQEASGATALMSLAAFFAPDDIPEELFQQDAALYPPDLGPVVSKRARFTELLGVLDDLSLIDFEPETRTFSIHRIVQPLPATRSALPPSQVRGPPCTA